MCEKKPEDILYYLVDKYKCNVREAEMYLYELENSENILENKDSQRKKRLREIKKRIISLILSVTILVSSGFYVSKIFNNTNIKTNNISKVLESDIFKGVSYTTYVLFIAYYSYKKIHDISILQKDYYIQNSDYKADLENYNEIIKEIKLIIESDENIRKEFISLYNRISYDNIDLTSEFDDLDIKEYNLKRRLKGDIYGKNI